MAFELPALPSFQTNIPQMPSALEQYGKMLQLKSLLGTQAMQPLQQEEARQDIAAKQLENQQRQAKINSQQAMTKAWTDPDITSGVTGTNGNAQQTVGFEPGFDPHALIKKLVGKGVLPEDAIAQAASFLEISKNLSVKTKDDLSNYKAAHEALSKLLTPIPDMSVADASAALTSAKQQAAKIPGLDPSDVQLLQRADLEHLPALINHLGFAQDIADFHKSKADATKAQQGVAGPNGEMSVDTQQQVAKDVAVATNPQIQAGKEAVAKAEGAAKAQIELAMEPLRLQIQQTFQNQKDARDKIETGVLKPFQDKMTDVQMARTAIAQAADNPVAARGAIFKMVGVAQPAGSHRVLPMEFTSFKYPGGITDQVKQRFNDFLKGEPWTPEIAQAASAFIDGQAQAAQLSLNSGVDNVNKLYGTTVGKGLQAPTAPQAAKPKDFFSQFGGQAR